MSESNGRTRSGTGRREFLWSAAVLGGGLAVAGRGALAAAAQEPMAAIRAAAEANRAADIKRIQDWIALPSIAAENRNMAEGAAYMADLARDAGFTGVKVVPSSGHPGVFGVMDNGAPTTLGLYFMYDVKQFDPAEWSSPPLEARIVDKPDWGKAIVGRGAINQKGPEATLLAMLHAMRDAGLTPPVNLVLLAEGEEEIGSPHFREIATRPEVLAALKRCAGIFIPAAWQGAKGEVSVNLGSKGVVELEPGAVFTQPPVSIPAGHYGIGHGAGAHAPDEYYVIESTNPHVAGITDATLGYAELLYRVAALA